MKLPTFDEAGKRQIKRITTIVDEGLIAKVFYPVFSPDKNAEQVNVYLARRNNP